MDLISKKLIWDHLRLVNFSDYRYNDVLKSLYPPISCQTLDFKYLSLQIPTYFQKGTSLVKWSTFLNYYQGEAIHAYLPAPQCKEVVLNKVNNFTVPLCQNYDAEVFSDAYKVMSQFLHPYCDNSSVLSIEEAFDRMNLTKSAGRPWSGIVHDENGKCTKRGLFNDFPRLLSDNWISKFNTRFMFSGYTKEELLLAEKTFYIDPNGMPVIPGTRLFFASDPVQVHQDMMLCGDANKKLYECCWPSTPHALGWSKFHGNSEQLFAALPERCIIADVSNKDATTTKSSMYWCAQFTYDCLKLSERTDHVLHKLCGSISATIYSLVMLPTGDVVSLTRGNCSGQLNTSRDNTLNLFQVLIYDMLIRGINPFLHLIVFFMIICGDDSVLDDRNFDRDHLVATFATFGMRLKASVVDKKDVEFCSHKFVKIKDSLGMSHMLMALPEERLLSSLYHGYKNLTETHIFERLCCLSIECFPYTWLYELILDILDDLGAPHCYRLTIAQMESLWYGWEVVVDVPMIASRYTQKSINRWLP